MSSVSPLRGAAALMDQAAVSLREAVEHRMPVLFNRSAVFEARGAHAQTAMRQAEEAVELLRSAGPRGETLADSLQADAEYFHRVFDGRPFTEARHSLRGSNEGGKLLIRADRARLLDELSGLDDVAARQLLEDRLEAPLRRMAAGDQAALPEVALIAGMPPDLRPRQLRTLISPTVWDSIAGSGKDFSVVGSAAHIEAKAGARRYELARMPAEHLDSYVRGLLARDPDTLSPHDVRELALVGTLPDRVFPELDAPSLRGRLSLGTLIDPSRSLIDNRPVRATDDMFLREIEGLRMVRDGTAPTRQAAAVEIADILDTPLDRLTPQQLRRISVLNHLPAEHRPLAPTKPSTLQFARVGLRTGWTVDQAHFRLMLEDARSHFHDLRDPSAALAELRAALVADRPFDVHRMATLLSDPVAVRAAGIDDAMVARTVTRQLQGAGTPGMKGAPLQQIMEGARATLVARTLRPEFEPVRTATLELIDRNLGRMTGARRDTFGRHPDYAEVGRVAAQLQLLDAVDRRSAAAAVAKPAGETLTW